VQSAVAYVIVYNGSLHGDVRKAFHASIKRYLVMVTSQTAASDSHHLLSRPVFDIQLDMRLWIPGIVCEESFNQKKNDFVVSCRLSPEW